MVQNINGEANIIVTPKSTESDAKEISWNRIGTRANGKTLEDIFANPASKANDLNFEVNEQPLMRVPQEIIDAIKNGESLNWTPSVKDIITTHKATYRTDEDMTLGVVGRDYQIVQNKKAFDFINFFEEVSGIKPKIETYGVIRNGERIFITATLGDNLFLNGHEDAVKNYFVFSTSHDNSGAVSVFFTPIRIICENTLNFAIAHCHNRIAFKHSKNVERRLDWSIEENRQKAAKVFGESVKFSKQFMDAMMGLKEQKVDADFIRNFTAKMYLDANQFALYEKANFNFDKVEEISTRAKNQIEALRNATDFGIGQEQYRGTKLWLLNGVTTFLHNERNWKSGEDEFNSLMFGDGQKKAQKAYDLLLAA